MTAPDGSILVSSSSGKLEMTPEAEPEVTLAQLVDQLRKLDLPPRQLTDRPGLDGHARRRGRAGGHAGPAGRPAAEIGQRVDQLEPLGASAIHSALRPAQSEQARVVVKLLRHHLLAPAGQHATL